MHADLQVLTLGSVLVETAMKRKRDHPSSEPMSRRSNALSLNVQHMDALVSFVLSEAMHAALAQPLECTAKLTSNALEAHGIEGIPPRMPPPLLLAAGAHPPYTKAADCILVEYGTHWALGMKMICSFTFSRGCALSQELEGMSM